MQQATTTPTIDNGALQTFFPLPLRRAPCLQTCPRWSSSDGSRSRTQRRRPLSTSAAGRGRSGGPRPRESVPRRVEGPWLFFFSSKSRAVKQRKVRVSFLFSFSTPVLQSKKKGKSFLALSPSFLGRGLSFSSIFDPRRQRLTCSTRRREQERTRRALVELSSARINRGGRA